ncbi:hypothetical protein GOP47_0013452 [Adiantum capillus-veneris]|uniref:TF-B3 domain-containing protein n=1 Tax=Adiantum capillus-veneris TaxID=13818 RepID=A0A9D4ZFS6_ADICA|nr:hypothetical protein GOP47_0013452 [Adiantum capillus-veneris]
MLEEAANGSSDLHEVFFSDDHHIDATLPDLVEENSSFLWSIGHVEADSSSADAYTSCTKDISDIKIVKEFQFLHRYEENCYQLSIEDTQTIRLQVSKLPKAISEDTFLPRCHKFEEHESAHNQLQAVEEPNPHVLQEGGQPVERENCQPIIEEPVEGDDPTFEDCMALDRFNYECPSLDIQDIAPIDSFEDLHCVAVQESIGIPEEASPQKTYMAALSMNDELLLSTSLSSLSTTDGQVSPSFTSFESMQTKDEEIHTHLNPPLYINQHAEVAPEMIAITMTDVPTDPYMCIEELPMLNNGGWDFSMLNSMGVNSHSNMVSFYDPSTFPTEQGPLISSCIFNPSIISSNDNLVYPTQKSLKTASYFSSIINQHHDQGCLTEILPFSNNNNLSWQSPAAKTRAARKRRMARKLLHVVPYQSRASSSTWSTPTLLTNTKERPCHVQGKGSAHEKHVEAEVSCIDETKLRFLLQKELKPSDVGSLGRIILPKKDAEISLPKLNEKEGMAIPMIDISESRVWTLRFRYWPNNKSRMYLLENTRDFVRYHHLREGDYIMLFKDDYNEKYVIRTRKFAK